MIKVYISGPISLGGTLSKEDIEKNKKAFNIIEAGLIKSGYEPVNPLKLHNGTGATDWRGYMADDIKALVDCHAIFMLEGWEQSKGAKLEYHIAKELNMIII